VAGSCVHGNERLGSINGGGGVLTHLSDFLLLKMDSAPRSTPFHLK
jgi:hypothetical protein